MKKEPKGLTAGHLVRILGILVTISFLSQYAYSNEFPEKCLSRGVTPCAAYFKKASQFKLFESSLYFSTHSKLLKPLNNQLVLLQGKVWIEKANQDTWAVYKNTISSSGRALLVKRPDSSVYIWTQLEGQADLRSSDQSLTILPGQSVEIDSDQISVPRLASADILDWDLVGFGPEISSLVTSVETKKWVKASQMGNIYRDVAASIEAKKDKDRDQRLMIKRQKDAEDKKYKDLFRTRHYNPEAWSEFLKDPDLSP